ncbi:hypothetical protein F0P96_12980 [Hymenobacter busanensis]|uniref:Uncharacterized protein n=1 Tax=Hymenobacter busanensis TaxID=2607656 RepID=A0A7L4ZYH2_9BACT|nr:hypothetical protein [Hymenobacter busanensis]KAA9332381.1 hypothetical protein F0P96_12980 [Hymenobacter busanensis]QHJ07282.1 hypothetical protein GUY19_08295 [Hymenobacter busanensis]
MKQLYFSLVATLLAAAAQAQSVGIGTSTPDPTAALDIQATGKGLLIPRLDSASRAGIGSPPDGLMVFQTDGRKGFWYAVGGQWVYIPDKTKSGDNLGNHSATQNLGLNDNDLRLRTATDGNHGLGWYGANTSTKNWLGQNIDGPVLYGFGGGVLGTSADGSLQSVLSWTRQGRVGIGTGTPNARLDLGQGALMLGAAINNNAARPAVGTARIAGEIGAYGLAGGITPSATADDGYLRLSAGGGSSSATKSFIDLAGYSTVADVDKTIRLGTAGTERLRVLGNGNVGIGRPDPQQQLHVAGNIAADGPLGVVLAAQDRPLVTRSWDAFTSGTYQGAGRWGVFMEPSTLAFGIPAGASGRSFKWLTYNANSTAASTLMTLTQDGDLQVAGSYGYATPQTRYLQIGHGAFVSNDPVSYQIYTQYSVSSGSPLASWLRNGTNGQPGYVTAPLQLPQGAVVTGLELIARDVDGTSVSPQVQLTAIERGGGTGVGTPYSAAAALTSESNDWQSATAVLNHTVRNDLYFYHVRVRLNQGGAGTYFLGVRVTYTVTQPE